MKIIATGKDARKKLLEGCQIMVDVVGTTYSPAGKNVAYGRQWGVPKIVHDGVSVAKEVEVKDELVQLGIDLIREAAQNQVSATGDGTSVTTILAYHIVDKGMKLIEEHNVNPMVLRKQILKALPSLINEIKTLSKDVKTREQIKHVALVSSDNEEIAEAVTDAVSKVGSSGLVTVELNKKQQIETEYTEGMELNRGWGSVPLFVTNPERMEAVIEEPAVLVLGRKITLNQEILPLIEVVIKEGSKNLVIIGEVSGDALNTLVVNKLKTNINALVVSPPGYGDPRRDALDDIALLTGASVVIDEIGMKPEQFFQVFKKEWIGKAKKIVATKGTTNIIRYEPTDFKDEPNKKRIQEIDKSVKERVEYLKRKKEESDSVYDKEQTQERLARLTTGIAVIKVGSKSEIETNEKLERVKDAVPAAQAAVEEGIVPGGGVSFLQMAKVFQGRILNDGEKLLYEVLHEPIRKILTNAGEDPKKQEKIMDEIKAKAGSFGYNVLTEKIEDLMKSGVIDPTRVIRLALENSVSVGTSILTTDAAIAIERKEVNTNMQMA